jgi:hypothetical protein
MILKTILSTKEELVVKIFYKLQIRTGADKYLVEKEA